MSIIEIYNTHCCGEIGDVIVAGDIKLEGETISVSYTHLTLPTNREV